MSGSGSGGGKSGVQAKASDLMIEALEREGVEYIFGIPGEENLDLLESLRDSKINLVITRHEQGAAFMAATVGRLTGKLGVCLSTLGPGATNFVTAAAYAQLGAMPMMMITGQKPIKKSKQARFQIIDVVEMMGPVTKYARQIVHGANIPSAVREAVRLAEEERPGAVHLELPEDLSRLALRRAERLGFLFEGFEQHAKRRLSLFGARQSRPCGRELLVHCGSRRIRNHALLAELALCALPLCFQARDPLAERLHCRVSLAQ